MKIRNIAFSLVTLLSMNINNVDAVEPQDSTRISQDTLKVCISGNRLAA